MTLDLARVKRRRSIMLAINSLAVVAAVAAGVGYFRYAQSWALVVFVAAMLAGFGAQIWFIAGLRGPSSSGKRPARETRVGKGA